MTRARLYTLMVFLLACSCGYGRSGGTDSIHAAIDYLHSADGMLSFKAALTTSKKVRTTLFIRDGDGDVILADRLVGKNLQRIYQIPSDAAGELVFEWIRPRRILRKKFRVERSERVEISVTRLG